MLVVFVWINPAARARRGARSIGALNTDGMTIRTDGWSVRRKRPGRAGPPRHAFDESRQHGGYAHSRGRMVHSSQKAPPVRSSCGLGGEPDRITAADRATPHDGSVN